eukprot:COSAG05_NODE_13523_length_426_cov_5.669725_2_plen_64_part_01
MCDSNVPVTRGTVTGTLESHILRDSNVPVTYCQGTAGTDSISISFTRQFQVLTKKIQITLFMHC